MKCAGNARFGPQWRTALNGIARHRHPLYAMRRLLAIAFLALSAVTFGEWMAPNMHVPISRLIANLSAELKKKPNDAHIDYLLGRLHSMAFAEGETKPSLFGTPTDPQFPVFTTVKVKRRASGKLSPAELDHLRQSLRFYGEAVRLEPKKGLFKLGLAWMEEEAIPVAAQLGQPLTSEMLRAEALATYREVYAENVERDLKGKPHLIDAEDVFVSEDAGAGMLRLGGASFSPAEKKEIEANVKTLSQKVSGITPIVFSLTGRVALADVVDPHAQVGFDFVGDGGKRTWNWVRPDTAILVWDPQSTGRIESGRQLFGSVTFWLFFGDGYAAMRCLDNNHDGWLSGTELKGISVWQDGNGNGVSDPGEVRSVSSVGIMAIRTRGVRDSRGNLSSPRGILFRNGRIAPTYDWIPSIK